MNKTENAGGKPLLDEMKEIARKYGVEVTDGANRGIRAIGILGGISGKYNRKPECESEIPPSRGQHTT